MLRLIMLSVKVVLTFESVNKTLRFDHSIERSRAVLSCDVGYYAVHGGSNF